MPRLSAVDRFADLPDHTAWPPRGEVLAEAIKALVHPRRRQLLDTLSTAGPASVGQLARRTGLAVGSVSHHTRVLASAGFIEPAPDLAGDTRESWWRAVPRNLTWGPDDFKPGSAGAELARLAGEANLDYLLDSIKAWQARRGHEAWRGEVSDTIVAATVPQQRELAERLTALFAEWSAECRADAEARPDVPRRPVRVISLVFPEAPRG